MKHVTEILIEPMKIAFECDCRGRVAQSVGSVTGESMCTKYWLTA